MIRAVFRRMLGAAIVMTLLSPALALTDEEVFRDLRFNLINPGGRSLALGGAFISLADDATAAQANPAGLSLLREPEYFVELRAVDNRANASINRESIPQVVDTAVAAGTDINDVISPSFLSAVTVYEGWALGLSLQELLNIDNSTLSSLAFTFPGSPGVFLAEGTGDLDLNITNFNVSAGVEINDRFRVGATLTLSRLDARSDVVNQIVDTAGAFASSPQLTPVFDLRTRIDDTDDEVVYSLGLMYQRDRWSAGAVYRRGPRFKVLQDVVPGEDVFDVASRFPTSRLVNRFSLPDTLGVGASVFFLKEKSLMFTGSIERLLYSNLLDGYVAGINVLTGPDARFDVDDANDYRVGVEYILPNLANSLPPMALRGGAFAESDTTIEAESTGTPEFATPAVFKGRGTLYHATMGVGLNFQRFKIDAAADFSESDNEYVISLIYKGKR